MFYQLIVRDTPPRRPMKGYRAVAHPSNDTQRKWNSLVRASVAFKNTLGHDEQ